MKPDLESFQHIVNDDAALRGRATLQPIGDAGDKVFPPTHSVDEQRLRAEDRAGAKYAKEQRRINGQVRDCVLLDSVQSQANRMEEALYWLWRKNRIVLPVVALDFGDKYPDLNRINSLTAPHRIADALLRDSLLDDTLFRHSGKPSLTRLWRMYQACFLRAHRRWFSVFGTPLVSPARV